MTNFYKAGFKLQQQNKSYEKPTDSTTNKIIKGKSVYIISPRPHKVRVFIIIVSLL